MELLWQELTSGLPDGRHLEIVLIRVIIAMGLGAVVGLQREKARKPAGLRTHVLVSLGTALVVLACAAVGMGHDPLSRVIQGIVTGIGFIGAGSILKVSEEREIKGLTTAAGLWMTAAIGIAAALGAIGVAIVGTVLTIIVLGVLGIFESRYDTDKFDDSDKRKEA
jgi:putative Mg2+ transporter-C (MgtC) family protein